MSIEHTWQWISDHAAAALSSMWAAAIAGRLTWHTRLVQNGHRPFLSWELVFEIPVVFFTWLIGTGVCAHFGWDGPMAGAAVAVVAYIGPGGIQAILQRYIGAKMDKAE